MRLRLHIQRNELPAVDILWPVPETNRRKTVAQLLELIDRRVPLENQSWGLEDYLVLIAGFEALHYDVIGDVFKDEDEIEIRPQSFAEQKTRLITGRSQISTGGRHLFDGVPFGRPLVTAVQRPEVRIPPRKKVRFEGGEPDDDDSQIELDEELAQLTSQELIDALKKRSLAGNTGNLSDLGDPFSRITWRDGGKEDEEIGAEDDDEDESDADFEDDEDSEDGAEDSDQEEDEDNERDPEANDAVLHPPDSSKGSNSRVDSSSDSSSPSFAGLSSGSDSESEDSDSSSDDTSSESWSGDHSTDTPKSKVPLPTTRSTRSKRLLHTNRKPAEPLSEHRDSESDAAPSEEQIDTRPVTNSSGIPFQGMKTTQARNKRRRATKKLAYLKQTGVLPKNASFQDLQEWEQSPQNADTQTTELKGILSTPKLDDSVPAPPLGETLPTTQQKNLVDSGLEEPVEKSKSAARRKKLDLGSTNRLVYGSLGVHAPMNQVDKDAIQKKLARSATKISTKLNTLPDTVDSTAQDDDDDPDAWQDKIHLTAVECRDEGVTLCPPPFPFKQRWDPQYQQPRPSARKKRKRNAISLAHNSSAHNYQPVETYDKYNTNGDGDALDYDDEPNDADLADDAHWEEGTFLGPETYDDDDNAADAGNPQPNGHPLPLDDADDFPPLPPDLATLPSLSEPAATPGQLIVFRELALSAATNWQPTMLTRTARIEAFTDPPAPAPATSTDPAAVANPAPQESRTWSLRLAKRDVRPRVFDDEGNRVYAKFEMAGLSDDEGEDAGEEEMCREVFWTELQDPRLLADATPDAAAE